MVKWWCHLKLFISQIFSKLVRHDLQVLGSLQFLEAGYMLANDTLNVCHLVF